MVTASNEVSISGEVDTKRTARRGGRRNWSDALKRQIVGETLEPGSSVSIVARRHDVNANQLFKWRRELLPREAGAAIETGQMVPVTIQPELEPERKRPVLAVIRRPGAGMPMASVRRCD